MLTHRGNGSTLPSQRATRTSPIALVGAVPLAVPFSVVDASLQSRKKAARFKLSKLNSDDLDAEGAANSAPAQWKLMDGECVAAGDGGTFSCMNPFTSQKWGQTPLAGPADVYLAVEAAHRAFENGSGRRMPVAGRAAALPKLCDLIEFSAHEIAQIEGCENGKLFNELGTGTISFASDARFFVAETVHGYTMNAPLSGYSACKLRERARFSIRSETPGYRRVKWRADTCPSTNNMIY